MRVLYLALIICLTALGFVCSCGGGPSTVETPETGPAIDSTGGAVPPDFANLPDHATTGLAAYLNGCNFDTTLGHRNVVEQGVMGVYTPDWVAESGGPKELAYAMYTFHLPEIETGPSLNLQFAQYGSGEDLEIGLGDYSSMTWKWLEYDEYSYLIDFDIAFDPEHHVSENGDITVLMVFTGQDTWGLEGIGIEEAEPVSAVTVDGDYMAGPAGTEIILVPKGVSGTEPYTYHWEFGTAATPAVCDSRDAAVTLTGAVGEHTCTLTVSNGFGEPFVHEFPLTITGEIDGWSNSVQPASPDWQYFHLPGMRISTLDAGGSLVASTSLVDSVYSIALQKFDGDGDPLFVRNWDGGEDMECRDMAVTPAGAAWILGNTGCGGSIDDRPVLIKVDRDGNPLLRVLLNWGQSTHIAFNSVVANADGSACLAGECQCAGLIAKVSADGSVLWGRTYEYEDYSACFTDLVSDGTGGYYAAGWIATGYPDNGHIVMRVAADGTPAWDFRLPWTDTPALAGLTVDGDGNLYILVDHGDADDQLLKFSPDGEFLAGLSLELGRSELQGLAFDPGTDRLFLTGALFTAGYPDIIAELFIATLGTDLAPGGLDVRTWGTLDSYQTGMDLAVDGQGRVFVVGATCESDYGVVKNLALTCSGLSGLSPDDVDCTVGSQDGTAEELTGAFVDVEYVVNESSALSAGCLTMRYDGFSE